MPLTITTHDGQLYAVELELATTVENLQLVVEIESGVPVAEQRLIHHGQALSDPTKTLRELGIEQDDVIILERQSPSSGQQQQQQQPPPPYSTHTPTSIGSQGQQVNPELMRQHVLSDPRLLQQLRAAQPELANAVNNPQQFAQLISNMEQERRQAVATRQREIMSLNADPFDVEAQRRIEEAIRQENVLSNMEAALEYNPESFGVVHMLYVNMEVNGHPMKAFVDSGAQVTIMSPECAAACGLMRLLDTRFGGLAKGVGSAKILGRVHSAQIRLDGDLYLPCSFTIVEGKSVDLLFGLDMLKRHQACIDLSKNALVIAGREIPFLAEHEVPEASRVGGGFGEMEEALKESAESSKPPAASSTNPFRNSGSSSQATSSTTSATTSTQANRTSAPSATPTFPEEAITTLTSLGISREQAIQALEACDGNVEMAASFLFGS